MNEQLWAADPHQYGPGKVHTIDPDNPDKTYCGRFVKAIPGKPLGHGKATCQSCLQTPFRREERKRFNQEWEQKRAVYEQEQEQKTNEWWNSYNAYLQSAHWKMIRDVVFKRDRVCQRCFKVWCDQAHHLSYETFNKHGFSFAHECVGLCTNCHEVIHQSAPAAGDDQLDG